MNIKTCHLLHTPFSGLGLYNGFRGNRWLKNRIKIFKQFVIPSLQAQTNKNFVLWCAFRREEKKNPYVKELQKYLEGIKEFKSVFTFNGICFWDDKYPEKEARDRLLSSLHGSIGELIDTIGEVDNVIMTIQPSDDCYCKEMVDEVQGILQTEKACGYSKGYIINYFTKEVREYNPTTNPPFYSIKFPREVFIDPLKHAEYTSMKLDEGPYKTGTPLPSHEYVPNVFGNEYTIIGERGFSVGCHSENISTHYNIPFAGDIVSNEVLKDFGLYDVPKLKIRFSIRKRLLRMLPHKVQRKLRYWWSGLYNFLRR